MHLDAFGTRECKGLPFFTIADTLFCGSARAANLRLKDHVPSFQPFHVIYRCFKKHTWTQGWQTGNPLNDVSPLPLWPLNLYYIKQSRAALFCDGNVSCRIFHAALNHTSALLNVQSLWWLSIILQHTHTRTKDWLWNILPFWIIEVLWPSKSPKSSIRTDSLFQSRADNSLGTCACTSPSKAACINKNDIIDVLMMAVLKKMIQMLVWKISNVSSQIYWISITLTLNFQYILCNQISSSTVIELPAIKFWDFWQDEASARVVGENWSTKLLPFNFTLARMPRSTASDQKLRLQQASSRKSLVTRLTGLTI